jgi:Fic family protein
MKMPQVPPAIEQLQELMPRDAERWLKILRGGQICGAGGKYRHWETMRRIAPPDGLTSEEWWLGTKFARNRVLKPLPIRDGEGRRLSFCIPDAGHRMLHRIDRDAAGQLSSPTEPITNPATRNYYLISSLMEEAITSSQLEGASTTRQVAKEMIRTGRPPRDKSERMILNNYLAMEHIRSFVNMELTPERVLELHRILANETLDNPTAAGRYRRDDEDVGVYDVTSDTLLYRPPPAAALPARMAAMCEFANASPVGDDDFLHPVVRAILLHLWLAMDHPFVDGNGRTARALFYWAMLTNGYWLCEFLSISRILKKAPAKYAESFLYVETDSNDATYFLLSQLRTICVAIDELNTFVKKKSEEIRSVQALLRNSALLNHRQLALLNHAVKNPGYLYTIESHRKSHNIVYETARQDLQQLEKMGLLKALKRGKTFLYQAHRNIAERLKTV